MKKNVAIIIQKLNGGGAERTAANLSIALSKKYQVHLIVFDTENIKYPYAGTLHDLKLPPENGTGKVFNVLKRVRAVSQIKKENNITASISLMEGANIVNVLSKHEDKTIASVRTHMTQSKPKSKMRAIQKASMMRFVAKRADFVVALSKGVENDLIDNYGVERKKAVTIYCSCDGELLMETARVHSTDVSLMPEQSITAMGRLQEVKGQWHLIRAFHEVLKKIPDAYLYILGQGPLEERLKSLCADLGISERVHFPGFVEAPHAYIMKSKVFVFPSLYEGMGNVQLEAMACGTPCISSDCFSGPREILAPGTAVKGQLSAPEYAEYGVLVSVGDKGHFNAEEPLTTAEQQMAEAMIEMLTNPALLERYRKQALKRVNDFSPERIAEQWASLIE